MDSLDFPNIEVPAHYSALIMSGPKNWGFSNVFDWVRNAVDDIINWVRAEINGSVIKIYRRVSDFIATELSTVFSTLGSISDLVSSTSGWVWGKVDAAFGFYWGLQSSLINGLSSGMSTLFSSTWDAITSSGTWVYDQVSEVVTASIVGVIDSFTWFSGQIMDGLAAIPGLVDTAVSSSVSFVWDSFLGMFMSFGSWVGGLLDTVGDWLNVDIPGHSPRWHSIISAPFKFIYQILVEFPIWFFGDFSENTAYGLEKSFGWIGDTLAAVFNSFNSNIAAAAGLGDRRSIGDAPQRASVMTSVGFTSIATLFSMTVAGELLSPLKRIGLGNLAAMVYDMTHYKEVTGAYMKGFANAALKIPLELYFNDQYRPNILPQRDFTELLSRGAFDHPEYLQNPSLSESMNWLNSGGRGNAVGEFLGYYGYPSAYEGLYRELANTRLGYFALAGIARTGFWDEAWFTEALARTGYSETARRQLMGMFTEQVTYARTSPILSHVRAGVREGFFTEEEAQELIAQAREISDLAEVRLMAIGLEKTLNSREASAHVVLNAFARGLINEQDCSQALDNIFVDGEIASLRLLEAKIGLVRKVTITAAEAPEPEIEYVSE